MDVLESHLQAVSAHWQWQAMRTSPDYMRSLVHKSTVVSAPLPVAPGFLASRSIINHRQHLSTHLTGSTSLLTSQSAA